MVQYLKGNYKLSPGKSAKRRKQRPAAKEKVEEEFERRALEKLGGSIAFVMKSKTFVWSDDGNKAPRKAVGRPHGTGDAREDGRGGPT